MSILGTIKNVAKKVSQATQAKAKPKQTAYLPKSKDKVAPVAQGPYVSNSGALRAVPQIQTAKSTVKVPATKTVTPANAGTAATSAAVDTSPIASAATTFETPQQTANRVRAEQGLPEIDYEKEAQGTVSSPASSAVSSTDQKRNERRQTRETANRLKLEAETALSAIPGNNTQTSYVSSNPVADQALTKILAQKSFSESPQGKKMLQQMEDMYTSISDGSLSPEEKAQVESEVNSVKAQYDELIADAQHAKDQGMPKAEIAAGQAGGFMNTQFAGIAALMPTQGGTFSGTGGELNRIQSEYDRNIQSIQSKQLQAMEAAKRAAIGAIQTGKKEDLQWAVQMYNQAKESNDEVNALNAEKAQAIYDWQKNVQEMEKYQRESAGDTISAMVDAGLSETDVPAGYLDDLDKKSGYVPGTSAGLMRVSQGEKDAKSETAYLDQMTKVMNITEKLKPNQSVTIGGVQYFGTKSGTTFEGKEIDKATGDVLMFNRDTETGVMSVTRQTGLLTPNVEYTQQWIENGNGTKSLWYVPSTPDGGDAIPVNGSQSGGAQGVNTGLIQQKFPAGLTYAEAVKSDPSVTKSDFWCLRFIGNMDVRGDSFINLVGDSLASKTKAVDPSINVNNAQAGDYIITNEDATNGHFALINEIRTDPKTGKKIAVLTESNFKPLTVGHTRTIELSNENMSTAGGRVVGFMKSQLKPEFTSQEQEQITSVSTTGGSEVSQYGRAKDSKYLADVDKLYENLKSDPAVKNFTTRRDGYNTATSVPETGSNAQQQISLVYAYMKLLDPESVVRDTEFETAKKYDSVLNSMGVKFANLQKGTVVSDEVVANMKAEIERMYNDATTQYEGVLSSYSDRAESFKLDPDDVFMGYTSSADSASQASTGPTTDYGKKMVTQLSGRAKADGSTVSEEEANQLALEIEEAKNSGTSIDVIKAEVNRYLGY